MKQGFNHEKISHFHRLYHPTPEKTIFVLYKTPDELHFPIDLDSPMQISFITWSKIAEIYNFRLFQV